MVICYADRRKRYSVELCLAFAKGCHGRVSVERAYDKNTQALISGMAFWQKQMMKTIQRWWEADHGYFNRGEYYRITYRKTWHDGEGTPDFLRLRRLGVKVDNKRKKVGDNILVVLQSHDFYSLWHGAPLVSFEAGLVQRLKELTKRKIVIRRKPMRFVPVQPPLEEQLEQAACVVTLSSNVSLLALAKNIPVVVLDKTYPAAKLGIQLENIDTPTAPDAGMVNDLFGVLAANQWTIEEMRYGVCWRALQWAMVMS